MGKTVFRMPKQSFLSMVYEYAGLITGSGHGLKHIVIALHE
jgi:hypothetical protein